MNEWHRIITDRRLLRKYIVYLVLILLPLAINLIGFVKVTGVLKNQIQKNNISLLENIGAMGDDYLEQMRAKSFSLLTSDQVTKLQRKYIQTERKDMVADLEGLINSFFESNEFTVTVVVRNRNLCVQNNLGACTTELVYESTFKDVYDTYDRWISSIFSEAGAEFKVLKTNSGQTKIYLVYYIPSILRDAAVITELDSREMKGLLSASSEESIYIMTDSEGEPLIVPYEGLAELPAAIDINGSQIWLGGVEYWQCIVPSGVTEWNYVNLIPTSVYLDNVRDVRNTLLIGYLMFVVGFAVIAYLFSKSSRNKEKQLAAANSKYESYMKENLLRHLITGKASDSDKSYLKQRMFINGESYCVVLFDIHYENDELLSDNIRLGEISDWIMRKTEKLTDNYVTLSCITVDGMFIGIAKFESETYKIKPALERLCRLSRDDINVDIYCTVSDVSSDLDKINLMYNQVIDEAASHYLTNAESVVLCSASYEKNRLSIYDINAEETLVRLLSAAKADEAVKFIDGVLKEASHITLKKIVLSEIVVTIVKFCETNSISSQVDFNELYDKVAAYFSTSLYYTWRGALNLDIHTLCREIKCQKPIEAQQSNDLCNRVKEYIDNNYTDNMISVNQIADHFGINRSWLSLKFKQSFNENISEYIVKLRIKKSKELLLKDYKISRIAEEVGFTNQAIFTRAFKKYESITAGMYRELLKSKQDTENSVSGGNDE
ncbi:MAG: helix-turn-helix transcriptional regulator [Clostridia bacterium]|nr:helix-turn-helix transcriptional regulator [Clostridia bacterium]